MDNYIILQIYKIGTLSRDLLRLTPLIRRSIQVSEECLINDTKTFEAKEEGLRGGKIHLAVDPRRGTVLLGLGKSGTEYFHQQVCSLFQYNCIFLYYYYIL